MRTRRERPGGRNTPSHGRRDGCVIDSSVQNLGTHFLMIRWRMVFGGIVSRVGGTGLPVEVELFGFDAVDEPMMAHVERF